MSKFSYCFKSKYLLVFQSLCLASSFLFTFCFLAIGEEARSNPEILERKAFIEKAMAERMEQVRNEVEEDHKRGIYPVMVVATLKPFGDWDFYYVYGWSIEWKPNTGQSFKPVRVPRGFVTDLASIPRVFWQGLRPEGRYAYAAVVHDYLYWEQNRSREEADQILKIAMEDSKVDPKLIETIYFFVRKFGQAAWDNNAGLKKAGERRILKRFPEDFTTSWSEWKKQPGVFADK